MFALALLIGIYSYIILAIGLSGFLYKDIVIVVTTLYLFLALLWHKKSVARFLIDGIKSLRGNTGLSSLLIALLILQALVNLVGALGPELSFDALWYHLTLPKLYLVNHAVVHIPGGLLYYSDMPKLVEMLYVGALSFHNEILAKIIHYFFGILTMLVLYRISRKYFNRTISLIVITVFYSNLVVGWQSTTAYVDLAWAFFETLAFYGFLLWIETKEKKWLIESAVMLGLAVTTKLLAVGSLMIFLILIVLLAIRQKRTIKQIAQMLFAYSFISLLIPLPWFIFSFVHTGNPIYPLFSSIYPLNLDPTLVLPIHFISVAWSFFSGTQDPILPIYLIVLPLIILYWKRFTQPIKLTAVYSLFAFIIWYFTSQGGSARYLLAYLPAFSLLVGAVFNATADIKIYRLTIYIILFLIITSIGYRTIANAKYVPVIIGKESKSEFLKKNLNFSFGDFYDTDGFFRQTIRRDQIVLLYGFHNLYYADFSFIHESWAKKGNIFNYVAVLEGELPKRFTYWDLVYINPYTHVRFYSLGGKQWVY